MGKYRIECKWGVIFILVMLGWTLFERLVGWHSTNIENHATGTLFFAIPAIGVYTFGLLDKRNHGFSGIMTWKQGALTGVYITIVVVILSPVAQYLIHTIITPDYLENMADYAVRSGNMNREDSEAYFSLSNYMLQGAVGSLLMGLMTSAVVALFTRKTHT